MTDSLVISRDDATLRRLTLYFTGKPCARGHVAPRRVVNFNCVVCQRERDAKLAEQQKASDQLERKRGRPKLFAAELIGRDIRHPWGEWPDNGRVEVVTDPNWLVNGEPRVVRKIGWRSCMCCKRRFFSQDITKVRTCDYCKEHRDGGIADF